MIEWLVPTDVGLTAAAALIALSAATSFLTAAAGIGGGIVLIAVMAVLMPAQAQRVVYEKAISEGLSDSSTAKLASGASAIFAGALKALEKPEVVAHLNEEGGLFSKSDKMSYIIELRINGS